jgi:hypothetical protein
VNLRLFLQVIGRFRYLILAGFLLAVASGMLAMTRVTFDGMIPRLEYRGQETWESVSALLVTREGFSYGLATLDEERVREIEEGRLQRLAALYARMAKGDAIRKIVKRQGPIEGEYGAERSADLPVVRIVAHSSSPKNARYLSGRVMNALAVYLRQRQVRNEIPADERVRLEVLEEPRAPILVEGRKKTRPIFLFVLILSATVMLAFALENLRPRVAVAGPVPASRPTPVPEATRKTA